MLLSKARERGVVGNNVPENMVAAEKRLEELSEETFREAEKWGWSLSDRRWGTRGDGRGFRKGVTRHTPIRRFQKRG